MVWAGVDGGAGREDVNKGRFMLDFVARLIG